MNIIAGGITGDLLASAALITEAKKPTVIMLASTSTLVEKSPYFVRTSCTLAQSSGVVADWTVQQGLAKVVTFVTDFSLATRLRQRSKVAISRPAVRSSSKSGFHCKIPTSPLSCSGLVTPTRKPSLPLCHRLKPARLASNSPSGEMDKAGIKLIGPGDIADDELLPSMDDAMLGTITAHFYSAAHPSPMNKAFVTAFQKDQGVRPNFMVVSGYDGMHLIYEALRKSNGATDGDTLVAAMRGQHGKARAGRPPSIKRVMSFTTSTCARSRSSAANSSISSSRPSRR